MNENEFSKTDFFFLKMRTIFNRFLAKNYSVLFETQRLVLSSTFRFDQIYRCKNNDFGHTFLPFQ